MTSQLTLSPYMQQIQSITTACKRFCTQLTKTYMVEPSCSQLTKTYVVEPSCSQLTKTYVVEPSCSQLTKTYVVEPSCSQLTKTYVVEPSCSQLTKTYVVEPSCSQLTKTYVVEPSCSQLTKTYVVEPSCSQLLLFESATYLHAQAQCVSYQQCRDEPLRYHSFMSRMSSVPELLLYIYTSGTTGPPKAAKIPNHRWVM